MGVPLDRSIHRMMGMTWGPHAQAMYSIPMRFTNILAQFALFDSIVSNRPASRNEIFRVMTRRLNEWGVVAHTVP